MIKIKRNGSWVTTSITQSKPSDIGKKFSFTKSLPARGTNEDYQWWEEGTIDVSSLPNGVYIIDVVTPACLCNSKVSCLIDLISSGLLCNVLHLVSMIEGSYYVSNSSGFIRKRNTNTPLGESITIRRFGGDTSRWVAGNISFVFTKIA